MRIKIGLRSGGRKEEFGKPQPVVYFLVLYIVTLPSHEKFTLGDGNLKAFFAP